MVLEHKLKTKNCMDNFLHCTQWLSIYNFIMHFIMHSSHMWKSWNVIPTHGLCTVAQIAIFHIFQVGGNYNFKFASRSDDEYYIERGILNLSKVWLSQTRPDVRILVNKKKSQKIVFAVFSTFGFWTFVSWWLRWNRT